MVRPTFSLDKPHGLMKLTTRPAWLLASPAVSGISPGESRLPEGAVIRKGLYSHCIP